jgi:DNA-binding transcriptional regulator YdaS (Cro superfamily)
MFPLRIEEVIQRLREACDALGSQAAWANAHGVSTSHVNDFLHGRRAPGEMILERLGLIRRTIYQDVDEVTREEAA